MVSAPITALQPGMNSPAVKQLQDWLVSQGFMTEAQVNTGYGTYGPQTTAAVKAWQTKNGVDNSSGPGYWGPKSIAVATKSSGASTGSQDNVDQSNLTYPITKNFADGTKIIEKADGTYEYYGINGQLSGQGITGETSDWDPNKTYEEQMNPQQDIKNDGSTDATDPSSSDTIVNVTQFYNKTPDETTTKTGFVIASGILNMAEKSGVSQSTIDAIKSDPAKLNFYVNAVAYGGYTATDVWKEIKRQDAISKGDTSLTNTPVINGEQLKSEYGKTSQYTTANSSPVVSLPALIDGIETSAYNLPIFNLPDDLFNKFQPMLDITSDEFKSELDNIKSLYYDNIEKQLNAKSNQEHALALAEFEKLNEQLNKTYGLQLSNNAFDAYDQLNTMGKQFSEAGISDSGIAEEAKDRYLNKVRKNDALLRDEKLDSKEKEKMDYYINKASPAEIKKALDSGEITKENLSKWGMIPSDEDISYYSLSNLKTMYPEASDEYLKMIADSAIDTSTGFPMYKSTNYHNLSTNLLSNYENKTKTKQEVLLSKNLTKEENAYKKYSATGVGEAMTEAEKLALQNKTDSKIITPAVTKTDPIVQTPAPTATSKFMGWDGSSETMGPVDDTPANRALTNKKTIELKAKEAQNPVVQTPITPVKNEVVKPVDTSSITKNNMGTGSVTSSNTTPKWNTGYKGSSVQDFFTSSGLSGDKATRAKYASEAGITGYDYSAAKNTELLKKLRGF